MSKINVMILSGGPSAEHEVSFSSAREVILHLDKNKYEVLPIFISHEGKWLPISPEKFLQSPDGKNMLPQRVGSNHSAIEVFRQLHRDNQKIDICFLALHGPFGEDGTIQAVLEFLQIPYTGSGILASALGMDKLKSRQIFAQAGLNVPKTFVLDPKTSRKSIIRKIKFPLVIKPNNQGSSVGVYIVHKKKDLEKAIGKARKFGKTVLIEEYIKGLEITCGIVDTNGPQPLPIVEIVPKNEFFDYQAKYTPNQCEEIAPARISKKLTRTAQQTALAAYRLLGCRGFGRVDMIIKKNRIYVLEVNTIPGLTAASLLPKAAKAQGISFSNLLDLIIKAGIHDHRFS